MPSGDAITGAGDLYDRTYYSAEPRDREEEWEALSLEAARRRMRLLEGLLGFRGRLLEVGCGTGSQLQAAREMGWEIEGVDISASAAAYARERLGIDVKIATLEQVAYPEASFGVVWLSHVVEHVPRPVQFLREVTRVLVPGGMAVISVPNSRGLVHSATNLVHRLRGRHGKDKFACSLSPPSHLYAFNEQSLRIALDASGLVPEVLLQSGKGDPTFYPVLTWRGAGRWPVVLRAVEALGRRIGRGSMLECFARRPP